MVADGLITFSEHLAEIRIKAQADVSPPSVMLGGIQKIRRGYADVGGISSPLTEHRRQTN